MQTVIKYRHNHELYSVDIFINTVLSSVTGKIGVIDGGL